MSRTVSHHHSVRVPIARSAKKGVLYAPPNLTAGCDCELSPRIGALQVPQGQDPGVYGDAALYDEAGGADAGVYGDDAYGDLPARGGGGGGGGGGVYGDDAYGDPTYDEAGNPNASGDVYGGGEVMYDSAGAEAGAQGYRDVAPTSHGDYDDDMSGMAPPKMVQPDARLERPLDSEPWYHGQITRGTRQVHELVHQTFSPRLLTHGVDIWSPKRQPVQGSSG